MRASARARTEQNELDERGARTREGKIHSRERTSIEQQHRKQSSRFRTIIPNIDLQTPIPWAQTPSHPPVSLTATTRAIDAKATTPIPHGPFAFSGSNHAAKSRSKFRLVSPMNVDASRSPSSEKLSEKELASNSDGFGPGPGGGGGGG